MLVDFARTYGSAALIELTSEQFYWLMPEYGREPVRIAPVTDEEAGVSAEKQKKAMIELIKSGIEKPTVDQVLDAVED